MPPELPELPELPGLVLPPVLEPLLPDDPFFMADSNSLRLIWPLPSASALLKSRPCTLAASERSM